jgi:hypothetical protein
MVFGSPDLTVFATILNAKAVFTDRGTCGKDDKVAVLQSVCERIEYLKPVVRPLICVVFA